jgi:hypothetical protein
VKGKDSTMMQKIGFAHHCAGHFIREFRHTIDTNEGKKHKNGFVVEADIAGEVYETLEEAEAWCRANPQKQERRTFGQGRR